MQVYHGTLLKAARSIETNGVLLSECRNYTDFGRGFYVSEHYEYAKHTALKRASISRSKSAESVPVVVTFEFDTVKGAYLTYPFYKEDMEWLQFIVNNRNGLGYTAAINSDFHNIEACYDIVSGRIADGHILLLCEELNNLRRPAEVKHLSDVVYKNNPYATQVSFHTQKGLKCLQYVGYEILKEV